MNRETAINVLLGAFLIFALAVPFFGLFAALYALDAAVRHYWPGSAYAGNNILYALIVLGILYGSIRQVRKKLWPNAFLYAAAAATMGISFLASQKGYPFSSEMPLASFLSCYIFIFLPRSGPIFRAQFIATASFISASFALNSGLLGKGFLATLVEVALFVVIGGWVLDKAELYRFKWPNWPSIFSNP